MAAHCRAGDNLTINMFSRDKQTLAFLALHRQPREPLTTPIIHGLKLDIEMCIGYYYLLKTSPCFIQRRSLHYTHFAKKQQCLRHYFLCVRMFGKSLSITSDHWHEATLYCFRYFPLEKLFCLHLQTSKVHLLCRRSWKVARWFGNSSSGETFIVA